MRFKKFTSICLIVLMIAVLIVTSGCGQSNNEEKESKSTEAKSESNEPNPTAAIKAKKEENKDTKSEEEGLKAIKENGKPVVIGVTLMSLRHPFFQDMKYEMEKVVEETGCVMKQVDPDFDAGLQAKQVEDFIQQKVDAILISPPDSKAIGPAAQKAIDAGIPVITIDSVAEGADTLSHVPSDNVEGGRIAARLLIGDLKERGIEEGVVGIVDHPTVTSVQDRVAGFTEVMNEQMPNIDLEQLVAMGQRDKAMSVTEDAIQKFGDKLVGVFGINDDSALGALSAIERTNKLDDISIVGYDLGTESKEAIDARKIVGDAVQFPGYMGRVAMETAIKYVLGIDKNPPKVQVIEVGSYTKEGFRDQNGNKIEID